MALVETGLPQEIMAIFKMETQQFAIRKLDGLQRGLLQTGIAQVAMAEFAFRKLDVRKIGSGELALDEGAVFEFVAWKRR